MGGGSVKRSVNVLGAHNTSPLDARLSQSDRAATAVVPLTSTSIPTTTTTTTTKACGSRKMSFQAKRKYEELDDSDDEEPTLGRQVLPVANLPETFDGVPVDGLQYLFMVR